MINFIKNLIFPLKINYITDNKLFQDLYNEIKKHKICAIDTEFMRNRTYYPILCLIQINVNGNIYIIDPLIKNLDISPLYQIFEDQSIKKIIHSARHDLEVLFFDKKIKDYHNIIDTQIMANFCDFNHNIGYKLLTKELCSKKLNGESQRSNWQKRPLSAKQLKYAALDVKYLLKIYQKLEKNLKKNNRSSWFKWEMKDFIEKTKNHNSSDIDNLIKRFYITKKDKNYIRNIKLLVKIRDDAAKKRNVPRNFVIHDNLIEKILESQPKTKLDFKKYQSLDKKISNNEKEEIIKIFNLKNIEDDEESDNQKITKFNNKQKIIYQKIKNILEEVAKNNSIDKSFIINDRNLKKLILKDISILEILQNWRYDIFGKKIKTMLIK